jgi:Flp pilus assembly protein TadD
MPTLNVVMIVKNEAGCLGECLDSVREIADRITIGDTGSTDDTASVARQYGAEVLHVAWRDDFAAARNHVLAAASGDWLLHLDADEVLDPDNAGRVRRLVDADGNGADAIEVTLANYCDDLRAWRWVPCAPSDPWARGFAGYVPAALLRLFRNGRGFEYREPVHENITESVRERGGVARAEPILIHHYGYAGNSPRAAVKKALYLEMARRKTNRHPENPKAWHDRAELEFAAGETAAAEAACRRALLLDPLHLAAATTLANVLLNRGDLDEARTLFERLETGGIAPPHVVTALGAVAYKQGRLDEARRRLEAVVAAQPKAIMARYCLARTLDCLGDTLGAREQLDRAAATAPSLKESQVWPRARRLRDEGENSFRDGALTDALKVLVEALHLDPEDPVTQNDLGVVLNALGQTARARECFERALLLTRGMSDARKNLDALRGRP